MAKHLDKQFEFDDFKGPPRHGYDVIGRYDSAPQGPPNLSRPTGKPDPRDQKDKRGRR